MRDESDTCINILKTGFEKSPIVVHCYQASLAILGMFDCIAWILLVIAFELEDYRQLMILRGMGIIHQHTLVFTHTDTHPQSNCIHVLAHTHMHAHKYTYRHVFLLSWLLRRLLGSENKIPPVDYFSCDQKIYMFSVWGMSRRHGNPALTSLPCFSFLFFSFLFQPHYCWSTFWRSISIFFFLYCFIKNTCIFDVFLDINSLLLMS